MTFKLYKFLARVFYIFLLIPAKILYFLKSILNYTASIFVYVFGGNYFFKNFQTDNLIIKKIKFKNFEAKVKINNFWDYWRIKNFEKYPLEFLINEFDKDLSNKTVFYEIGANTGYCSLLISKLLGESGKVYAFEVEPTNFKTLCDNVILNKFTNLIPLNLGISDSNKLEKFYYNKKYFDKKIFLPQSAMGMHSLEFNDKVHSKELFCNSIFIEFDKLIELFKLDIPTHIFIDAYGAEEKIIKSILKIDTKKLPKYIMVDIEENIKAVEESEVYQMLTKKNYKLLSNFLERGNNIIPDSYKSIFKLKN